MAIARAIEDKVRASLTVSHLELENESHMHAGPPNRETHFRLVVVSEDFAGLPLVRRHQRIMGLLEDERRAGLHALGLHTFTPEEWVARGGEAAASPACRGGGK